MPEWLMGGMIGLYDEERELDQTQDADNKDEQEDRLRVSVKPGFWTGQDSDQDSCIQSVNATKAVSSSASRYFLAC